MMRTWRRMWQPIRAARRLSRTDNDLVLDFRHAWCLPCDPFGLLTLRPCVDRTFEDDHPAVGLDGYAAGVELGAAPKVILDLLPDVGWRRAWSNQDKVRDALDASNATNR